MSSVRYFDNESLMELDQVPGHLVSIRGGYAGVEFAQMFRRFGAAVTFIQRAPRLLPREDPEFPEVVEGLFRNQGIDVRTNAEATEVSSADGAGSHAVMKSTAASCDSEA